MRQAPGLTSATNRRTVVVGNLDAVLVDKPLPHPPGRMALLAGRIANRFIERFSP